MNANTTRVLQLFADQPHALLDSHDVADATLITHTRARRALHNLSRYHHIEHVGGYVHRLPDRKEPPP